MKDINKKNREAKKKVNGSDGSDSDSERDNSSNTEKSSDVSSAHNDSVATRKFKLPQTKVHKARKGKII